MLKIYLAAPLFTAAERKYNVYICGILEDAGYDVFLPQREVPQYESTAGTPGNIFICDLAGLRNADCVVAICDGADVDSGTAWECGHAFAIGMPIIALRTDFRAFGVDERFNLMIEQSARKVVTNICQLLDTLPLIPMCQRVPSMASTEVKK